jgi:hypothetical protein
VIKTIIKGGVGLHLLIYINDKKAVSRRVFDEIINTPFGGGDIVLRWVNVLNKKYIVPDGVDLSVPVVSLSDLVACASEIEGQLMLEV